MGRNHETLSNPLNRAVAPPRITIIEVLIVTTSVALMMSLCAISIQLLMKLNADVQARFSAAVTLDRLSQRFRDDAHASETTRIIAGNKPAGLHLSFEPGHSVDYESGDGGVVRTESRAGKVVRHETYVLARGGVGHFEERVEGSYKLVALVVAHTPAKSRLEPPRPVEVVALAGKDRARPPAKQGDKSR